MNVLIKNTVLTILTLVPLVFIWTTDSLGLANLIAPLQTVEYHRVLGSGVDFLKILLMLDILLILFLYLAINKQILSRLNISSPLKRFSDLNYSEATFTGVICLCAIVSFALTLRILHLNSGLWIDEYLTLINYVKPNFGFIATNFEDDNQHLLFSILAKISTLYFGEAPWSLRLPAMIVGVLSIISVYNLGRLVFTEKIGLLAAFLLCVSYHHIWYSQNARGYTILLLGTVLSAHFLLKSLDKNKTRDWLLFSVSLTICVTGHLTGIFVGLSYFLFVTLLLAITRPTYISYVKPLVAFGLAALLTLHSFALMIPQMLQFFSTKNVKSEALITEEWKNPLWAISEIFAQIGIPTGIGWNSLIGISIITIIFGLFLFRRHPSFFCIAVIPAILTVLVMLLLSRNLWPRLIFNIAGFITIFLSILAYILYEKLANSNFFLLHKFRLLPIILLCVAFSANTLDVYSSPKQDFSSALQFIDNTTEESDTIVALHVAGKIFNQYYGRKWSVVNSLEEFTPYVRYSGRVWVVYTLPNYVRVSKPELHKILHEEFQHVHTFPASLGDGEIIIVKSKS